MESLSLSFIETGNFFCCIIFSTIIYIVESKYNADKMKFVIYILLLITIMHSQDAGFQIARLKYSGGSDWYNDPSAEVNLLNYINDNTNISVNPDYVVANLSENDIFNYPLLFITGHGNIVFSDTEIEKLKAYLENCGFIYIYDDYGLNSAVRREMKKVFPEKEFVELPFNHGIYNSFYNFEFGPPKIHEHDNNPPQGFGLFVNERLAVYYTYESNPSDGWADPQIHNNPREIREEALKFGTNLVVWVLSN